MSLMTLMTMMMMLMLMLMRILMMIDEGECGDDMIMKAVVLMMQ